MDLGSWITHPARAGVRSGPPNTPPTAPATAGHSPSRCTWAA